MTKEIHTTRTCAACGQKKPLVAFLELAGAQVHTYGDICATCRGTGMGKKKRGDVTDPGEKSGGTTRFQLDNKARMMTEKEKIQHFREREDEDYEEKMKKEELQSDETEKEEETEKTEKKHREEYFDQDYTQPESTADIGQRLAQESTQEKTRGEKQQIQHSIEEVQAAQETAANTTVANKEESKKSTNDMSVMFIDDPTATLRRSGGSIFSQFRQMLGQSAAINRTMAKYAKNNEANKTKAATSSFLNQANKTKPQEKEQKVTEFINNNFKKR